MLMGMERLASIVPELLANGADSQLPVALIRWGTTGRQETLIGKLGSVVAASAGFEPPAIAVFGRVVELREKLRWFEKRPLFGRRIVVTRTRKQASALSAKLRALGADVYEIPTIRIEPPENLMEFGELVRDAFQYDWLIFTSVNGVDAFFEMFYRLYDDARSIGNVKIAAIGPATAQRIKDLHLAVDLQPEGIHCRGHHRWACEIGQRRKSEDSGGESSRGPGGFTEETCGTWGDRGRGDRLSDGPGNHGYVRRSGKISSGGSGSDNLYQFVDGGEFSGAQASMAGEDENGKHRACHLRNDAEAWPVGGCRGRTIRCGRSGGSGFEALCNGKLTIPPILVLDVLRFPGPKE